ncbi:MAG: helix-turn-helix transcriptional regulator, partial [Chloroflexota bacterium]|nr:helix-turn-helix transcriptional regulator [Chloroflexota bacterium]
PGQGVVYRQNYVVSAQSSFVREREREMGDHGGTRREVGISYGYMIQVSRGHRNMSVKVQARVKAVLGGSAKVESAQRPDIDRRFIWERMDELGVSQNEVTRWAGISSAHLSQIMNGRRSPSAVVIRKLHGRCSGGHRLMSG